MSKKNEMNIYKIIVIIIFLFFTFFKLYNALTAGLMEDEPETLYNAGQIYQGKLPFIDYFEHHPVMSYILLAPLSDISIWKGQRILMAFLNIIGAIFLYLFLSRIFDKRISILCTVSFLLSPLLNRMAIMIIPDSFMIFFFIVGLYFLGNMLENNNAINYFLLGFFWSLSILSKFSTIIPIIIFMLVFLILYPRLRKLRIFFYLVLGSFIPLTIIFVIYHLNFGNLYKMIEGLLVNSEVKIFNSQSLVIRQKIFVDEVFSMYVFLWILGIVGTIIYLIDNRSDIINSFKVKNDERSINRHAVILSSILSFILLVYFNLKITAAGWPQYYMVNVVLLSILLATFYDKVQKNWKKISNSYIILLLMAIYIFFAVIQPFMMSTYPFQPDNHKEEEKLIKWINANDRNDKYTFENWIYFNHLAGLKSDYKVPLFSDVTFYYLTSKNESFLSLSNNVFKNPDYDTIILHGPMFNDLYNWIDNQFNKRKWYLAKRYYTTKNEHYNDQKLFWYPGIKIDTYKFQIDIWKRK